jgi:hypothetical protein
LVLKGFTGSLRSWINTNYSHQKKIFLGEKKMSMKNLIASGLATLAAMFRRKEALLSNIKEVKRAFSMRMLFSWFGFD